MSRQSLIESIANEIADYRAGEWSGATPEHVERWIDQFDVSVQEPLLAEVAHLLNNTYISKVGAHRFLDGLALSTNLTGPDPKTFWQDAGFLNIQSGGSSQRDMLEDFDQVLRARFVLSTSSQESASATYVYLDDVVFSGTRLRQDIESWLPTAPTKATLHVITMGLHTGGEWHAKSKITEAAKSHNKQLDLHFWHSLLVEDRRAYLDNCDVLRPTHFPTDDPLVAAYIKDLEAQGYPPAPRTTRGIGPRKFYSSPEGRELLEQQFLILGAKIRSICPNLRPAMRPLGFTGLRTLGFGAVVVTYRNCPNNCPLTFWVGDPWHALFPRKTNTESSLSSFRHFWKSLND